ncbi:Uncharacterised protein [Vibrio cholerae]|uniref:Uncharacterized protein n=1 Tax=Vibrio cholerae TaxID=666 RepID=A0A656AC30_VIBCL|nr:Uncharacterised protein [Vibrio cholerae]CSB74852.1 Uncharacterised protein [Vibrio cholerae]CSB77511.1 Uncharacterised protein [Vibrio cholerae]CSC85507.1 Uncharacterised protein [Vibrio cholerae]CSD01845.1 Uncharacterised protein [Vibrio cholerae]
MHELSFKIKSKGMDLLWHKITKSQPSENRIEWDAKLQKWDYR